MTAEPELAAEGVAPQLPREPGDELDAIVYALPEIVRGINASRNAVTGRLTMAQVRALLRLVGAGSLTMGELARRMGVSCAAATQVIDQLVALGLVVRERPEWDRRRVLVRLAGAAEPEVQRALERRRRQVGAVLAQLTLPERQAFARGVQLLARVLAPEVAGGEGAAARPETREA